MQLVEFHHEGVASTAALDVKHVPAGQVVRTWAIQVVKTGTAGTSDVDLYGSLNGTTFFKIADHSNTSGDITFVVDKPVRHVQVDVASLTAPDTLAIYVLGAP